MTSNTRLHCDRLNQRPVRPSFCVTLPSSEHILQNLELLNPETVSFQFSDHFNLHFTTSYLPRICSCSHNYSNTRHLLTQPPTNALAAFQIILNFNIASDYMSHLLERRPSTEPGKAQRGRARARLAANGGAPKSFATVVRVRPPSEVTSYKCYNHSTVVRFLDPSRTHKSPSGVFFPTLHCCQSP